MIKTIEKRKEDIIDLFTQESTYEGTLNYFRRKTLQLNLEGFRLIEVEEVSNLGVVGIYLKNNQEYYIFYLYKNLRGKGIYERVVKSRKWKNIIVSDPKNYDFFRNKKIKYLPLLGISKSTEYVIACDYYKDKTDENGVPLIYKLDVRLYILRSLGGSYQAVKAMCMDETLKKPLTQYGSSGLIRTLKEYRIAKDSLLRSELVSSKDDDVKKMITSREIQRCIINRSINKKSREKQLNKRLSSLGYNTSIYKHYESKIKIVTIEK